MATFPIVVGDTSPKLDAILSNDDGAVDLTLAVAVTFSMWDAADPANVKIDGVAGSILDASAGKVRYNWASGDTDTAGLYYARFAIEWDTGAIESFPNDSHITVDVNAVSSEWTYGANPGTGTDAQRRDAVRLLIGDTDSTDQQLMDSEVAFALDQNGDDVYLAAITCCAALEGKYASSVDEAFEGMKMSSSQRAAGYKSLSIRLTAQAKKNGSIGLGVPVAGGISIDTMSSVREDTDRVRPAFVINQFDNPRATGDSEEYRD